MQCSLDINYMCYTIGVRFKKLMQFRQYLLFIWSGYHAGIRTRRVCSYIYICCACKWLFAKSCTLQAPAIFAVCPQVPPAFYPYITMCAYMCENKTMNMHGSCLTGLGHGEDEVKPPYICYIKHHVWWTVSG